MMENALDTRNSRNLNHQHENLENNTVQKFQDYGGDKYVKLNEQENYSRSQRSEHVWVLELESNYDIALLSSPLHDSCDDDIAISNTVSPINKCKCISEKTHRTLNLKTITAGQGTISSQTDFIKFTSVKQINENSKMQYSEDQLPLEDLNIPKQETSSSSLFTRSYFSKEMFSFKQKCSYTLHPTFSFQKLFYYFPSFSHPTNVPPDLVSQDSPEPQTSTFAEQRHSHSPPFKELLNEPVASSTRKRNLQSTNQDTAENNLREKPEDSVDYYYNYVLAYPNNKKSASTISYLVPNLKKSGLKVVAVRGKNEFDNMVFLLVHLPTSTIVKDAQRRKIRLSCMLPYVPPEELNYPPCLTMCFEKKWRQEIKEDTSTQEISTAEKIIFIHEKVNRAKFGIKSEEFGIDEMILKGIITAAYPLHEGSAESKQQQSRSDRQNLTSLWAKSSWYSQRQPLRLVNKYFGPEIAFYFAWMGYLAALLTPPAIFSFVIFLLSIPFAHATVFAKEICDASGYMCPLCLHYDICQVSRIRDSCFYGIMNTRIDNIGTLALNYFMGVYIIFLVMNWGRVQNELKTEWRLYHSDADHFLRPGFIKQLKEWKIKTSSNGEPRMPFRRRCTMRIVSIITMMGLILMMWKIVVVMKNIRVTLMFALAKDIEYEESLISEGNYYATIICAIFSGFLVILFSKILSFLSKWLADLENPRTEKEFNLSYITKLFILELFNHYAIPFHMALLREYDPKSPNLGFQHGGGIRYFNHMCDVSGCAADVAIQVSVVLTIKILYNWIGNIIRRLLKSTSEAGGADQWESDFRLHEVDYNKYIAALYMDIVMKYGFVVMFGVVLPFGYLLLVIDTVVSIRMNALMFCQFLRRPVPRRVVDLEIWYGLLKFITYIGLFTNILVTVFTTNASKLLYYSKYHNKDIRGYYKSQLTEISLSDYELVGVTTHRSGSCFYRGQHDISYDSFSYTNYFYYQKTNQWGDVFEAQMTYFISGMFFYYLFWSYAREKPYDEKPDKELEV
ncbi:hypothetical protein ILUMI_09451 [Ignelater luminosus]|uniref:Anoctamin n=1 Tax=Ignelater luminosus TaxID=2038154 RepID=A0A8K0D5R8_IGNLU|nr:hypothetical protein ILUMI_09451 [Ignelater luminosus]